MFLKFDRAWNFISEEGALGNRGLKCWAPVCLMAGQAWGKPWASGVGHPCSWIQLGLRMTGVSQRLVKSQKKVQVIYCVVFVAVFSSIPPSLLSCLAFYPNCGISASIRASLVTSLLRLCSAQSCPTLCNTMGCSPWDFPGTITGMGCHFLLQGILATQGSNLHLLCVLHCRRILYCWATREAQWLLYTLPISLALLLETRLYYWVHSLRWHLSIFKSCQPPWIKVL